MTVVLGIIFVVAAAFAWRVYQVIRDGNDSSDD